MDGRSVVSGATTRPFRSPCCAPNLTFSSAMKLPQAPHAHDSSGQSYEKFEPHSRTSVSSTSSRSDWSSSLYRRISQIQCREFSSSSPSWLSRRAQRRASIRASLQQQTEWSTSLVVQPSIVRALGNREMAVRIPANPYTRFGVFVL